MAKARAERRAATERVVTQALDEANLLRGQAKAAAVGDLSKWPEAMAALKQARSLLAAVGYDAEIGERVETLLALLEKEQADAAHRAAELEKDRKFLELLEAIRLAGAEQSSWSSLRPIDDAYAKAFREFGIDPDHLDPTVAG